MKVAFALAATILATSAFAIQPAATQTGAKAPELMTDKQMNEVVAGAEPGFGICTAVGFATAPGAIKNFGPSATINLPGNGNLNSSGLAPGFGRETAGKANAGCTVPA